MPGYSRRGNLGGRNGRQSNIPPPQISGVVSVYGRSSMLVDAAPGSGTIPAVVVPPNLTVYRPNPQVQQQQAPHSVDFVAREFARRNERVTVGFVEFVWRRHYHWPIHASRIIYINPGPALQCAISVRSVAGETDPWLEFRMQAAWNVLVGRVAWPTTGTNRAQTDPYGDRGWRYEPRLLPYVSAYGPRFYEGWYVPQDYRRRSHNLPVLRTPDENDASLEQRATLLEALIAGRQTGPNAWVQLFIQWCYNRPRR